jgi:hypothetical protein
MLQRLVSFALPTSWSPSAWRKGSLLGVACVALMGAVWLVPPAPVHAQTTVNYNFEDGVVRGDPTNMQVPPKILTENGNKFMRITGSAGDKENIPASYPNRNRSTVRFTSKAPNMPLITDSNRRQTYSADIRFHGSCDDGVNFELFQMGTVSGGYGTKDGRGPVIIMYQRPDCHVIFGTNHVVNGKMTRDTVDVGYISAGSWHKYMVKATWSHSPGEGRIEFYLDGKLKKTITGRETTLHQSSNWLPELKLGMYGDFATGIIDVDNVKAGPSSSSAPAPSVALSAPPTVRLASGE